MIQKKIWVIIICFSCFLYCKSNKKSIEKPEKTFFFTQSNTLTKVAQSFDNQITITDNQSTINPKGKTIKTRFLVPKGYKRTPVKVNSFAAYLRNLPLKAHGTKVHYYNGAVKESTNVYAAVVDMDVGDRDLQQCADAIMRLRAEHLLAQKRFGDIHFNFTNGFKMSYNKWKNGYRVRFKGNKTTWYKGAKADGSYKNFRKYMNLVFAYAGTLSLSKELKPARFEELQIGDILIQGGSPGHAVIVVDMAIREGSGQPIFLLAQSYMPAQDIQVLYATKQDGINDCWYASRLENNQIDTPEWTFFRQDLKRWEE